MISLENGQNREHVYICDKVIKNGKQVIKCDKIWYKANKF